MIHSKPILSAWQVSKICLGAFGIQFGFALPQANATRIFQNLGASLEAVPLLWLAQTQFHRVRQKLPPRWLDRLRTGLALSAALILGWRLRATLGFAGPDPFNLVCF